MGIYWEISGSILTITDSNGNLVGKYPIKIKSMSSTQLVYINKIDKVDGSRTVEEEVILARKMAPANQGHSTPVNNDNIWFSPNNCVDCLAIGGVRLVEGTSEQVDCGWGNIYAFEGSQT